MGPRVLVLVVFFAVFSVAQGLMCNYCQSIERNHAFCEEMEALECTMGLTHCIRLVMHAPAYGEIRRCATTKECEAAVPQLVEKTCCNTDLCN